MRGLAWMVGVLSVAVACSSSSDGGRGQGQEDGGGGHDDDDDGAGGEAADDGAGGEAPHPVCAPGDTRTCAGPGACRGAQTCLPEQNGFGPCDCGARASGGAPSFGGGLNYGGDPWVPSSGGTRPGSGGVGAAGAKPGTGGRAACSPEPLDLFLMVDQSSSMGDLVPGTAIRWWDEATQGLNDFLSSPAADGIGVGMQYFPLNGVEPASCTAPYSTPEVALAPLPGIQPALSNSLAAHAPTTFTPTGPALQGAVDYMKGHAAANPGHRSAVVFLTDGFPTECEPRAVSDIALIAKAAYEEPPSVSVYVVGFSQGLENLSQIASAGGTKAARLIDGGLVSEATSNALLAIAATRCPN